MIILRLYRSNKKNNLFENQSTNLIGSTESSCDANLATANGFVCVQNPD